MTLAMHPKRYGLVLLVPALALAAAVAAHAQSADDGHVPGWMGVTLGRVEAPEPDADDATGAGVLVERPAAGARVLGVVLDSPADRAGLRASDVIVQVDGREVGSPGDLVRLVRARSPGAWIELLVRRKGDRRLRVQLRLDERPERLDRDRIRRGWIGIEPVDVPEGLRRWWGRDGESGVLLGDVTQGGPAWRAGVRPGDLVLAVDGEPVARARELVRAIRSGGVGNRVTLEISRQGPIFEAEIAIEREPPPDDEPS